MLNQNNVVRALRAVNPTYPERKDIEQNLDKELITINYRK
jgi:hypothetical protein